MLIENAALKNTNAKNEELIARLQRENENLQEQIVALNRSNKENPQETKHNQVISETDSGDSLHVIFSK